jgi:hypothetical protein
MVAAWIPAFAGMTVHVEGAEGFTLGPFKDQH